MSNFLSSPIDRYRTKNCSVWSCLSLLQNVNTNSPGLGGGSAKFRTRSLKWRYDFSPDRYHILKGIAVFLKAKLTLLRQSVKYGTVPAGQVHYLCSYEALQLAVTQLYSCSPVTRKCCIIMCAVILFNLKDSRIWPDDPPPPAPLHDLCRVRISPHPPSHCLWLAY
jgi:hypothetical protein